MTRGNIFKSVADLSLNVALVRYISDTLVVGGEDLEDIVAVGVLLGICGVVRSAEAHVPGDGPLEVEAGTVEAGDDLLVVGARHNEAERIQQQPGVVIHHFPESYGQHVNKSKRFICSQINT